MYLQVSIFRTSTQVPGFADVLSQGVTDNMTEAEDIAQEHGIIARFAVVNPKRQGLAQHRERLYMPALKLSTYANVMRLTGSEDKQRAWVTRIVDEWKTLIEMLDEDQEDHFPVLDLDMFLAKLPDPLLVDYNEKVEKKAAQQASAAKKGRKGTAWKSLHNTAYGKASLNWSDPSTRDAHYHDNNYFRLLTERERDIVLFYDLVQPVTPGQDESMVNLSLGCCRCFLWGPFLL